MKRLIPLLFIAQCFNVQPSHASASKAAFLSEGSHGTWTRCVASVVANDSPTVCGTDADLTVCSSADRSLWATRWHGTKAEVYYASPDQEPAAIGYVEELTTVSAVLKHGRRKYACEVRLVGDRMVVEYKRK